MFLIAFPRLSLSVCIGGSDVVPQATRLKVKMNDILKSTEDLGLAELKVYMLQNNPCMV